MGRVKAAGEREEGRPVLPKVVGVPEERAWLLSRLFFAWMQPLFRSAQILHKHNAALEHEDLLPLPRIDHGAPIIHDFDTTWHRLVAAADSTKIAVTGEDEQNNSKNDANRTDIIRKAIFAVIGPRFVAAGVIKFFNSVLQFSFPLILNAILKFIEQTQGGRIANDAAWYDKYRGYWLAALLFLAMAGKAVTENAYFMKVMRSGYQARVAISVAVYNKSLRLANAERQSTTLGELVNLLQVDSTKVEMVIPQLHVIWDGLVQICGTCRRSLALAARFVAPFICCSRCVLFKPCYMLQDTWQSCTLLLAGLALLVLVSWYWRAHFRGQSWGNSLVSTDISSSIPTGE
jgi:ABC transporter transmembrane region